MKEHERRYRSSIGKSSSEEARARYRGVAPRDSTQIPNKKKKMTYDDFLAESSDAEKIIEIDEESRVEKFLDLTDSYMEWVRNKRKKYAPIVKEKAKGAAKKGIKNQPITKDRVKGVYSSANAKLDPLREKYGEKNVSYSLFTGTAVLVLLGGFVLFSGGGGEDTQVAGGDDGQGSFNGSVQGVETPQEPTFDVVTPDTVEDEGIFFDPSVGVASFRDQIRTSNITISQQPLTDEQKADRPGQLELISVNLLADVSFETQFGTTYLTHTAPDGTASQVVMFMTDELLVFMRTPGTSIAVDDWVNYINTINN